MSSTKKPLKESDLQRVINHNERIERLHKSHIGILTVLPDVLNSLRGGVMTLAGLTESLLGIAQCHPLTVEIIHPGIRELLKTQRMLLEQVTLLSNGALPERKGSSETKKTGETLPGLKAMSEMKIGGEMALPMRPKVSNIIEKEDDDDDEEGRGRKLSRVPETSGQNQDGDSQVSSEIKKEDDEGWESVSA